jgi:hydrogenase maturation protease
MTPILVIGYGNELLGDDAAGPRTAAALARENRAHVRSLSVPQLTPELAEPVGRCRRVIFIDTTANPAQHSVQLRPVEPATHSVGIGHASRPAELLALALALYGRCPSAWMITLPGSQFAPGTSLSPLAELGVADALARIRALVDRLEPAPGLADRSRTGPVS